MNIPSLLGCLTLTTVLVAQPLLADGPHPSGEAARVADGPRQEPERLERWPVPADPQQLEVDVQRLRKAATEGMERGAREALRGAGAAAAPGLVEALRKERDPAARARVVSVLVSITGPEHTRLLAPLFEDRSPEVRIWALGRAAAFPDPGLRGAAEAARERTLRALEHPKLREEERDALREERYRASLCCAAAGSIVGLDELVLRARQDWARSGPELRTALVSVRGPAATERLTPLLEGEDRTQVVAALSLLAVCGEREGTPARVKPLLDHTDNTIRVAAINALRGIVDGDPPLDRLPVFEAIEQASAWKRRL
jgi:hypothetical protein